MWRVVGWYSNRIVEREFPNRLEAWRFGMDMGDAESVELHGPDGQFESCN